MSALPPSPAGTDDGPARVRVLLAAGQPQAASQLAEQLCQQQPLQVDHWLVLARCLAGEPSPARSMQAYARARSLSDGAQHRAICIEQARWLHTHKDPAAACQVLASCEPHNAESCLLLAQLAAGHGNPALALAQLRVLFSIQSLSPASAAAMANLLLQHGLGRQAEAELATWLAGSPATALAWLTLARLQRERGQADAALASTTTGLKQWPADPALADLRSGLLQDLGRADQALASARAVCAGHGQYLPGLNTLSNLLWEHGSVLAPGVHPASPLRDALAATPQHKALRIELVSFLLNMGEHEKALQALRPLLDDPHDALAQWYLGNLLAATGQLKQAEQAYLRAEKGFARHPGLGNARTRLALRRQRVEQAEQLALRTLQGARHDQEALSLLSLAWRLRQDARYHWLCDYQQLVAHLPVPCPSGHADSAAFLLALEQTLDRLHQGSGQPLVQSVRQGSQTSGRLFGRDDVLLQATQQALQDTVRAWLDQLPRDPRHPFMSRNTGGLAIVGSWSVAMAAGGHHANHIHSQGWLSSAFHVRTVQADEQQAGDAGCLQLGQPLHSLGLDLAPERIITPRPGWLALFPSYFWHGTVPVHAAGQRLSIAFDAQPAA